MSKFNTLSEKEQVFNKKFGSFLKSKRKERGWSQQKIADILKIPRSTYASWEIGNNRMYLSNCVKLVVIGTFTYADLANEIGIEV